MANGLAMSTIVMGYGQWAAIVSPSMKKKKDAKLFYHQESSSSIILPDHLTRNVTMMSMQFSSSELSLTLNTSPIYLLLLENTDLTRNI